ncbi:ribonuclease III [Panus rudis PR-1116 ss-1]|nr:ribonuclease III [Panus rudis PR-1116 ss-1]
MVKSSQQNSAESSGGPIVSSRLSPSSYIDQSTSQNGSNSPSGYFFDVNPDTGRHIKDPMTGRRIKPSDSVEVLQRFLADLSRETNPATLTQSPKVEKLLNDQYVCKVDFPVELSLPSVFGPSRPSRAQAEEDACFQACQRLFDLGLLNSRFFPDNHSTPALTSIFADAPIATGGSLNRYHKIRPGFWNNTIDMDAHRLYPTVVEIENQPTGASYARMLILTRSPLPHLGKISLFPFNARVIASMHHGAAFQVNDEKLHTLYRYTLRLSRALTNKPLEGTLKQMPYLFAPLDSTAAEKDSVLYNKPYTSVVDLIHWESVKLGAEVITLPLIVPDASIEETCRDVVLQDRCTELSRRFDLVRIRHDLTPHSKAEDSPREAGYSSFLEYCKSRRRDFGELRNNDQPMLEVTPIPPLLDFTSPAPRTVQQPPKASLKYLIPELCCKITIPARYGCSVFRTAQMLPSILHRIDDMLVTKQLNEVLFDGSIDEHLLLSALTPVAARAEHDYERLELLGRDAFLKYMSSTFCYTALPEKGEGGLHSLRNTIVSNKALVSGAQSIGLPGYIRGRPFVPGIWSPFLARGSDEGSSTVRIWTRLASSPKRGKRTRQQEDQYTQTIADKAIADVVEAIIGAAYISTDKEGALRAAKTLGVALPQVEAWSDFKALSTTTAGSSHHLSTEQLHAVEHIVGFKFKRSELLAEALTHSSMHAQSKTVNYDRLEFLGDAILDLYVVQDLFDRYPHLSSGGLSMLRSAMVVNTTLATICVLSGIYKFISYASTDLKTKVEEFAVRIKALYHLELQQSKAESRPLGQFWVNVVAPKSLSDVVEAILGALFVSEDFSDIGASTFFKKQILPFLEQHVRIQTLSHHPSKTLYETFHAEKCEEHQMVKASENGLTKCSGTVVIVHNVVLAEDVDPSPSIAVRKAASAALRALEGDAGFMTRVCDCRLNRALKKGQKSKAGVNLGYDPDEDTLNAKAVE